jgi:hypothetical protein
MMINASSGAEHKHGSNPETLILVNLDTHFIGF